MVAVFKSHNKIAAGSALDRAAICVSSACLVQCMVLTLAILLAPFLSLGFFGSDELHRLLLAIILPLSLGAFFLGYRIHRNARLLVPGLLGLGVVILAAVLEATVLEPLVASALTSLGGVLIISAHWLNLRHRRRAGLSPGPFLATDRRMG